MLIAPNARRPKGTPMQATPCGLSKTGVPKNASFLGVGRCRATQQLGMINIQKLKVIFDKWYYSEKKAFAFSRKVFLRGWLLGVSDSSKERRSAFCFSDNLTGVSTIVRMTRSPSPCPWTLGNPFPLTRRSFPF